MKLEIVATVAYSWCIAMNPFRLELSLARIKKDVSDG
jgi:hypothetical protein